MNKTTHHTFRPNRSSTITPTTTPLHHCLFFSPSSHNPTPFSLQTNYSFSLSLNRPIHNTQTCNSLNHWVPLLSTVPPQFIFLLKFSFFFTLQTQLESSRLSGF